MSVGSELTPIGNNLAREWWAARAYGLYVAGLTYRGVASELGVSVGTAHTLVKEARASLPRDLVDDARKTAADRLAYLRVVNDKDLYATDPKVRATAIGLALRINESERRLVGTDPPKKIDLKTDSVPDAEERLAESLKRAHDHNEKELAQMRKVAVVAPDWET